MVNSCILFFFESQESLLALIPATFGYKLPSITYYIPPDNILYYSIFSDVEEINQPGMKLRHSGWNDH